MQGSANLRIAEQLAVSVIILTRHNLRQTRCFCYIIRTCLWITNKEIVVLVRIRFNQTKISIYIINATCHLNHKWSKHFTDTLHLIRHCFISLKNCLCSCRITDQIDGIFFYIGQAVCVFRNRFCLNTAIYRRIRLPTSLKIRRKHNITSACQFHAPGIIGMSMIGTAMIDYGYGCRCFIGCVLGYVDQGTHGCSILTGQIQPFDFYATPACLKSPDQCGTNEQNCHAGSKK